MTTTPRLARGVIDAATGALLAVTGQGINWLRADDSRVDVTPDFNWGPVAAGGGAVAVAGSEYLRWHGADGEVHEFRAPSEVSYRLAVAGSAVAAVSKLGQLTCWRSPEDDPRIATLDIEPDGLVLDPSGSRVAVWGWDAGGDAVMAVLDLDVDSMAAIDPAEPWPPSEGGVAFLADGTIGVGGAGSVNVLLGTGRRLGSTGLPGLERITGSTSGVAWIRSPGDGSVVAGTGVFPGPIGASGLTVITEQQIPDTDPFPEFAAVVPGELVLVAGAGPHRLAIHRLTGDGWAEPTTITLPDRA